MADTKISDLTAASALGGTEVAPVVQSGTTKKATATQIKTFVESTYASGVVTFLTTPSGANLASALTTALPASKGGTGLTALGTGVATALGVNVGSAGAPVVLNGAGGTPSAIDLTNATNAPAPSFRGARVYRSAAFSPTNLSQTAIAFDAESFDTDTLHDNSTNPSRVVLNKVGKWLVTWQLAYAGNATGVRDASLALNGTIVSIREKKTDGLANSTYVAGSDIVVAAAITDYIELTPFQSSGGDLALTVGSGSCFMSAVFLGS